MIVNFYAVKDELTNTFLAPTTIRSDEEAKRAFGAQINNIDIWKDNPGDFSLYKLGSFDDETGTIISDKKLIAGGRSVLNA